MEPKKITILFSLLIMGSIFIHFNGFEKQKITIVDEPAIIVASIQAGNQQSDHLTTLVKTNPLFGLFLFGNKKMVPLDHEIMKIKTPEEAREYFFLHEELFNHFIRQMRIVLALAYLSSAFLLYVIGRKFLSINGSLLVVLLFVSSSLWSAFGKVLFFEIIQLPFILFSLFFLIRFFEKNKSPDFLFFAFYFIGAIGIKLTALYLLPGYIIFILFSVKITEWKATLLAVFLLIFSLIAIPFFMPQVINFGNAIVSPSVQTEVYAGFNPIQTIISLLKPDFSYAAALILLILIFWNKKYSFPKNFLTSKAGIFGLMIISIILFSSFVVSNNNDIGIISRYNFLITIPIYFLAALSVDKYLNARIEPF